MKRAWSDQALEVCQDAPLGAPTRHTGRATQYRATTDSNHADRSEPSPPCRTTPADAYPTTSSTTPQSLAARPCSPRSQPDTPDTNACQPRSSQRYPSFLIDIIRRHERDPPALELLSKPPAAVEAQHCPRLRRARKTAPPARRQQKEPVATDPRPNMPGAPRANQLRPLIPLQHMWLDSRRSIT